MKDLFLYTRRMCNVDETPLTIYEKIVGDSEGFLLESNDEIKGRYSFIAKNYREKIQSLDEVKGNIKKYNVVCSEDMPFVGGYVGIITYDVAKRLKTLKIRKMIQ